MPRFEHDHSKYLSQEEKVAMRLALRGQVVLKVVAMLEALGVDEPAIEAAVQRTRERIADMSPDTLRALGGRAVGMAQLLDGESLDTVESEEGDLFVVQQRPVEQISVIEPAEPISPVDTEQRVTSELSKRKRVMRMKPNREMVRYDTAVRTPIEIARINEETVSADIAYMFADVFSFDELKLIENLNFEQRAMFVEELIKVYQKVVEVNSETDHYKDRLLLLLEGLSVREVSEKLDTPYGTVRAARQKTWSMLARDPVGAHRVLSPIFSGSEGVEGSNQVDQLALTDVHQTQLSARVTEYVDAIFGTILSEEEQGDIVTFTPGQKDVFVAELMKAYENEVPVTVKSMLQGERLRHMLDGMTARAIADVLNQDRGNVSRSKKSMKAIFDRCPDEVHQAYHTARQLEVEEHASVVERVVPDSSEVDMSDDISEPDTPEYVDVPTEPTPNESHEQEVPIDRLIEDTFLDLMHEFDFGYSEVKGLIDRLKGTSNQMDSGLVKANIAFLTAARQAGELLDESESALLRAHFALRPGRPPLSPSEIVELFKDIPGIDIDTVQRSIVGALAKLKGVRS